MKKFNSERFFILVHDESTFKNGEISAKRWMVDGHTPFFSKGQGRPHMVSDFLVQHPPGLFFSLSDVEFRRACNKYPSLASSHNLNYLEHSATARINVGQDDYFDNNTVLTQFERLLMLLPFKEDFKDHEIELVVDNARTLGSRI